MKNVLLTAGILAFLCFFIYSGTLHFPFHFDTLHHIQNTLTPEYLKTGPGGIFHFLKGERPLGYASLFLNYCISPSPFGFRLFNIIIHFISSLLLYIICAHILKYYSEKSPRIQFIASLGTAAVFCVHPVAVQCVSYVYQRMTLLCMMFGLLCFLFFLLSMQASARKRVMLISAAALFCLFSTMSKEIGVLFPAAAGVFYFLFQPGNTKQIFRQTIILAGFSALLIFLYLMIFSGENIFFHIMHKYNFRSWNAGERMLTQLRALCFYIRIFFVPSPDILCVDRDFTVSRSLLNPVSTLFSGIFLVLMLSFSLKIRKKYPLYTFCMLWFFVHASIEASFLPIELAFDHRAYIPCAFFPLGCILFLLSADKKFFFITISFILTVIGIFTSWSRTRNQVFSSSENFWEDCLKKSPKKPRVIQGYCESLMFGNPDFQNLALKKLRELIKNADYAFLVDYGQLYLDMGYIYFSQNDYENAQNALIKATIYDKYCEKAYYFLSQIYYNEEYYEEALQMMHNVSLFSAENSYPYIMGGMCYEKMGNTEKAVSFYLKAVEMQPYNSEPHRKLFTLYFKLRQYDSAYITGKNALQFFPDTAEFFADTAAAAGMLKKYAEAVQLYKQALTREPENADILRNLKYAESLQQKR